MKIGRPDCSVFSSCICWRKASCNTGIREGPWRRPVCRIRAMEGNSKRTTRQPVPASPLAMAAMNGLSIAAPAPRASSTVTGAASEPSTTVAPVATKGRRKADS